MSNTVIIKIFTYAVLCAASFMVLSQSSNAFDASVGLKKKSMTEVTDKTSKEKKSVLKTDEDDTKTNIAIIKEAQIELGKGLFGNTCLFCHGAKGVGARAPSLITGHWGPGGANDDEYMMQVITKGRPGTIMGSFEDSHTVEEIKAIMAYLRHEAKLLADSKAKAK